LAVVTVALAACLTAVAVVAVAVEVALIYLTTNSYLDISFNCVGADNTQF
jgi:hypothetical protein